MIAITKSGFFPMEKQTTGVHFFGGPANHRGSTPEGSSVPLHKLLSLDLTDSNCPIRADGLRYLPFYYPLKYGYGGPSLQYEVLSDEKIRIVYMSDTTPDPQEDAYVKVESFPAVNYSILPSIPSDDDIDWFTITLGGQFTLDHTSDNCLNPNCSNFKSNVGCELLASIPPVPIEGHDDIWWEFEGAYMLFYFCICHGCNNIITFNWAT